MYGIAMYIKRYLMYVEIKKNAGTVHKKVTLFFGVIHIIKMIISMLQYKVHKRFFESICFKYFVPTVSSSRG